MDRYEVVVKALVVRKTGRGTSGLKEEETRKGRGRAGKEVGKL